MQENGPRSSPVIVITGTPGTGKTTHAQLLVEQSPVPLQHINVSELVKENMLHDGFDEEWQTYVVDEDKVRCSTTSWCAWYAKTMQPTQPRSSTNWSRWSAPAGDSYLTGIHATHFRSDGLTLWSYYNVITLNYGIVSRLGVPVILLLLAVIGDT